MNAWGRLSATGTAALVATGLVSSCSGTPTAGQTSAVRGILTTTSTTTTAAVNPPQTVLSQDPARGATLEPGATVAITLHHCPR